MRFEVAERIDTDRSERELIELARDQFRKVSGKIKSIDEVSFLAQSVEATFGSINRADRTLVGTKRVEGGWLLTAEVAYRPSVMFWVFAVCGLWIYLGWLIPLVFYLVQRNTVKNAVAACIKRVADEVRRPAYSAPAVSLAQPSAMDELEKLAALKERGFVTDEEFAAKKVQLLRRAA